MNGLIKNVTKVKRLKMKIAAVCKKKTIQFNNKWKSTDLKITVQSKDVCTEELILCFFFLLLYIYIYFFFFLGGEQWLFIYLSIYLFINFISKLFRFYYT